MKKRDIDIFGFLLGVVIGCILGFFLSTRIKLGNTEDPVGGDAGNVFLLQLDSTNDAGVANALLQDIADDELNAVSVFDGVNYYIYGGIALSEEDLEDLKSQFETKGYSGIVKKEYLLDEPNAVLSDQFEFEFWSECVDNLFRSMSGDPIVIQDKFRSEPVNLEIYSNFLLLESIQNEKLKRSLLLHSYEIIVESLG